MIEFSGYISGSAEKRLYEKSRNIAQGILLFAVLALLPPVIFFALKMKLWSLVCGYCSLFVIIPLLLRIPKSKKERMAMLPKRIYVEDEHIVCITGQYTESRMISDVKKVVDHGEFYELSFVFGKVSDKFICQKSLLMKGTLEEFEAMFGDKVYRK
jgi:hypothetical protein